MSGTVTFDRVPFNSTRGNGLDFTSTTQEPVRFAPVQILDASGTVLATTQTDTNGRYSVTVDGGQDVRVRVLAETKALADPANSVDFAVVDNTQSNALYALDGTLTALSDSSAQRDLNAGSGWTGSDYTQTRAAAPFAIRDTIIETMELFIGADPQVDFPAFQVLWSTNNVSGGRDVSAGQIGTSSYTRINDVPTLLILGDEDQDTDEFDAHIISHEFGHYVEDQLSRSDSIGGSHSFRDRLDPRVAFGEAWGNALSAITVGVVYRDSFGTNLSSDFGFNVETERATVPGWFNEASIQSTLYDIFDPAGADADGLSEGFGPIYRTLTDPLYVDTDAYTTVFSFADRLKARGEVDADALDTLLANRGINSTDAFGAGETNTGNVPGTLPVYTALPTDGTPVEFCSVDDAGQYNALGNRRFFTFTLDATRNVSFRMERDANTTVATDPDFVVTRGPTRVGIGQAPTANVDTDARTLEAGSYVVEAYDFNNVDPATPGQDSCFTLSATAN